MSYDDTQLPAHTPSHRGLRRRGLVDATPSEAPVVDPYKGNWLAETTRSTVADMENNITTGVPLLYHKLTGNQAGVDENVQQYQTQDARARALGPEIQSFEDAERAGGGLWNYAKALGYQGAAFVPDTAAALVSGGTAGAASLATKQAVKGIARRVATNAIENNAENQARRELMESTVRRQFGGKVVDEDAVSDAVRQAVGIENKYIRREAMAQVAAQAGRTPRALDKLPAVGTRVGMAAGYFPSALGESVELLSDPNTTQGDAAVLGAGAAVGAALNLLPMERVFNRIGSDAAEQTVRKFLPRVGSEMAKQGFLEAGQEVAQTATTLASHAIVKEDPTVLFDEKAREQYLMSALAGGIFGAGMGGGVEVSRSAAHGIKDVTGKVYNSVRDYVRDGMHRLAERQRARREARAAEMPPLADDATAPQSVGESLSTKFSNIVARMRDGYTQGQAAARGGTETVFNDQLDEKRRNDVAERVAARIDNGEPLHILRPARALEANPVAMDTPLQSHLMTFLRDDSPVWQQPETARELGQTLERIAQGEAISDEELAVVGDLGQSGDYDDEALAELVMGYDNRVKLNSLGAAPVETLSNLHRDLSPGEAAEFEAQQRSRPMNPDDVDISAAASGDTVNGGLTERSTGGAGQDPLGRLTPAEQLVSAQRGVQAANKHARRGAQAALDNTALLSERAGADAATQALAATHNRAEAIGAAREARAADAASRDAARDALRTQLLGSVTGKFEYGKNVVTAPVSADGKPVIRSEAMQKAWAFFDEKAKQPGVVRLENGARAGKKEGVTLNDARLLDMGSVIARKISELSPNFGDDARSQKALKQAAMAEAYGDLVLAGIKADPESVNHGYIPFKSGGGYYVTKAEAEGIRAMLRGDKPVKRQVPTGPIDRKTAAVRKETAKQRETALEREPLQPMIHGHVRVGQEEDLRDIAREGGGDFDDSGDFKQGPRKTPEGSRNPDAATDGRRFIPTEGVVTDVDIAGNPYEALLSKVRRARADKSLTPRQRGQVLHNVGVEIGHTELAKELENGTINPKRYAAEIKRLEDFDTGLARQYAKRAFEGAFDRARVVEQRARTEKTDAVDTEEARIERELYPASDNPNAKYRGQVAREKEAQKLDRIVEQTIANTPKEQQAELRKLDTVKRSAPASKERKNLKATSKPEKNSSQEPQKQREDETWKPNLADQKIKRISNWLVKNERDRLATLDPGVVQVKISKEMRKVIAAHVNADGTLKGTWLKAPNGKETELPPLQWVIVRTPSFKKWFGYDWERRASDAGRGGVSTIPGVDGSEGTGGGDGGHRRLAVLGLGVNVPSRRKVGGGNRVSSRGTDNVAAGADGRLGGRENRRVNRDGRSDPTLNDTGGDGRPANIHPVTLEPKLFYHGTYADFEAFDLDHPNKKDSGWMGEGVYLYTHPYASKRTAQNTKHKYPKDAQLRIIPLFARGQNFLYVTNEQKHANSGVSRADAKVLSIKLRNAGYDGVTTSAGLENAELMVLNPNDVKHASANQGGFNESDNIFQDRLEETKQAYERRIDALFTGAEPAAEGGVKMLDRSNLLSLLANEHGPLHLVEGHMVVDGQYNHGITAHVLKQLPDMLDNPVAVFRYENGVAGEYRFVATDDKNQTWLIGVSTAKSEQDKGRSPVNVTITAFREEDANYRKWAAQGLMAYLDEKKAREFNKRAVTPADAPVVVVKKRRAVEEASASSSHNRASETTAAGTGRSVKLSLKGRTSAGSSQNRTHESAAAGTGGGSKLVVKMPVSVADVLAKAHGKYSKNNRLYARSDLETENSKQRNAQRDDLLSGEATHDPAAERILKQGKFDKPTDGSNDEADLEQFNALATELLMEAGFDDPVRVEALDTSDLKSGGDYNPKNLRIRLNMRLPGPERMESFLHELGHHIVHATVAKHVGWKTVRNFDLEGSINALRHHEPELHAALEKDFKDWQAKHGNLSPAPFFRGKRGERRIDDHTRAFHEWLADNIARAMQMQKKPVSIVGKFFDSIATAFRRVWRAVKGTDYAPAKSVDAWVRSMFSPESRASREVFGHKLPDKTIDKVVKAAGRLRVDDTRAKGVSDEALTALKEAFGDIYHYQLPAEARAVLDKVLARPFAVRELKNTVAHSYAAGVKTLENNVANIDQALEATKDAEDTDIKTLRAELEALKTENEAALSQMKRSKDTTLRNIDHPTKGAETRAAVALELYASGQLETQGLRSKAAEKLGLTKEKSKVASIFSGFMDDVWETYGIASDGARARRILDDILEGVVQQHHRDKLIYDVRQRETNSGSTRQKWADEIRKLYEKLAEPASRLFMSGQHRLYNSGINGLREIATALHRPWNTVAEADGDDGLTPALTHETALWQRRTVKALDGLDEAGQREVMRLMAMQMNPEAAGWSEVPKAQRDAIGKLRKLYEDAHEYAVDAGVNLPHRALYHPVMFNVTTDADAERLTALYSQPRYEQAIRKVFSFQAEDGKWVPSQEPMEKLVERLVDGVREGAHDGAYSEDPVKDGKRGEPEFRASNYRISNFVYHDLRMREAAYSKSQSDKNKAELDQARANVAEFAALQQHDPAVVFGRYFDALVRHAEYTRRFGGGDHNRAKLDAMLDRAKHQGATPRQLQEAEHQVRAALGVYGENGSPVLEAYLPSLNDKIKGPRTRRILQGVQAYQNLRLLPLAALSSLVDPMGIAMRTGGDFNTAWMGFKRGFKSLFNKQSAAELDQMLEALGATDDMLTIRNLYGGGDPDSFAGKVNNFVFKYNGMQTLVHTTRRMAVAAGHGFLIRHSEAMGKDTKSRRYMDELKLQPGDVQTVEVETLNGKVRQVKLLSDEERAAASESERARDDRVRQALRRFVDEAILRPHSMQVPLWHNDPYMGLVTQYKAFGYAMWDQIGGRFAHEMRNMNPAVILAALAYLPIILMAELLRELIQYGTEGNPRRENWGADDYLMLSAERSGLAPNQYRAAFDLIGDVKGGSIPGASQAGPTLNQIGYAKDAFIDHERSKAQAFENALPGSAMWKHRFNPTES